MRKYETTSVEVSGAICGEIWQPGVGMCGTPHSFDVSRRLARFADASDATMRDVILHELMERGGNFQDARFSADTVVCVTRTRREKSGAVSTHSRAVLLSAWPDCSDLVYADAYASDFCPE